MIGSVKLPDERILLIFSDGQKVNITMKDAEALKIHLNEVIFAPCQREERKERCQASLI
jgi:hypothetical protein